MEINITNSSIERSQKGNGFFSLSLSPRRAIYSHVTVLCASPWAFAIGFAIFFAVGHLFVLFLVKKETRVDRPSHSKFRNSKHCLQSKFGSVFTARKMQTVYICHVICNFNYKIRSPPSYRRPERMHIAWLHYTLPWKCTQLHVYAVWCVPLAVHNSGGATSRSRNRKWAHRRAETNRDLPNFISFNFKRQRRNVK